MNLFQLKELIFNINLLWVYYNLTFAAVYYLEYVRSNMCDDYFLVGLWDSSKEFSLLKGFFKSCKQ